MFATKRESSVSANRFLKACRCDDALTAVHRSQSSLGRCNSVLSPCATCFAFQNDSLSFPCSCFSCRSTGHGWSLKDGAACFFETPLLLLLIRFFEFFN